ncbi:MAG: HEAT repeat domain-containing protein [Planctomycetota bacterium]
MQQETEVHFCNLCNTSIPLAALDDGRAVRVAGRCVPTASPGSAAAPATGAAGGRAGIFGAAVLILAGIAGAAIFVDWRMGEEIARLRGDMAAEAPKLARLEERFASLETRLEDMVTPSQLQPLGQRIADFETATASQFGVIRDGFAEIGRGRADMRTQIDRLHESQVQHAARLALIADDLRALGRDVAELRAAPVRGPLPSDVGDPAVMGDPDPRPQPAAEGFPPAIQHHLDRLSDADESVRFEAVQELLLAREPKVLPALLPLARDSDPFVRRLVLDGLAEHRSAEHVDALINALADPESIVRHSAWVGLKKLTAQTMPFDADAGAEQRNGMQKRWRSWWDKNRDDFR